MTILVIDGQGGKLGKTLVENIKKSSAILDDAMAHIRSLLEGMENKP